MNTRFFPLPKYTQEYYRLAVSSFFFIQGLVFASWASRIPDVKTALSLSDAQLGGVLFLLPVGQLSAMALSGWLVSRYGSRKMLTAGALLYPLALVGLGAAAQTWQLCAALYFFGMTSNLCNISVNTQGVGVERLYNRSIMASFHGLWSFAGFIGGLLSTYLAGRNVPPLQHFLLVFGITCAILITMRGSMLPRDFNQSRAKDGTRRKTFVKPSLYVVLLGVIAFGSMACEGTMYDWSAVFFQNVIMPPEQLIRLGYVACMFAMTFGRFTADRFVTRFGAVNVLRASGVIIACGLLLAVLMPYLYTATLGFFLVGLGTSSVVPLCYSLAGKTTSMPTGIAVATVSTVGFFGFLMTPPLIGFIAQAAGLRWAFALMVAVGLLTTFLAPKLQRAEQAKNSSNML